MIEWKGVNVDVLYLGVLGFGNFPRLVFSVLVFSVQL